MNKLSRQFISFIAISGIGWLIDFSVYLILIKFFTFSIKYANMISAVPAVTFVFFVSVRKTFIQKQSRIRLGYKYLIYFFYQIILLLCVSWTAQMMFDCFLQSLWVHYTILLSNAKILVKLLITPITMTINFFVMKGIIEKI